MSGFTFRIATMFAMLVASSLASAAPPSPPTQPAHGPGSSDYAHGGVVVRDLGGGARGAWVFTPTDPAPRSAPVVVFCHGWGALKPEPYRAWIDHIVRRGNIVVYPKYQDSLRTPPDEFLPNAVAGIEAALAAIKDGPVRGDTTRVAAVGHSAGGVLAAELPAVAEANGLPRFAATMPVEPGDGSREGRGRARIPIADLSAMPASTLLLVLVGEDDRLAGESLGLRIYDDAVRVPRANRNVLELRSDDHGEPPLVANHAAPSATATDEPVTIPNAGPRAKRWMESPGRLHAGRVDALDWYGTWKLFDALADAAFYGRERDVALGGGPAQVDMGRWSDGVAVEPMRVLR